MSRILLPRFFHLDVLRDTFSVAISDHDQVWNNPVVSVTAHVDDLEASAQADVLEVLISTLLTRFGVGRWYKMIEIVDCDEQGSQEIERLQEVHRFIVDAWPAEKERLAIEAIRNAEGLARAAGCQAVIYGTGSWGVRLGESILREYSDEPFKIIRGRRSWFVTTKWGMIRVVPETEDAKIVIWFSSDE